MDIHLSVKTAAKDVRIEFMVVRLNTSALEILEWDGHKTESTKDGFDARLINALDKIPQR